MPLPNWNDDRERIYRWMVGNGQESFAELYNGCVANLNCRPPGHVRFICHGVRDIMNRMPAHKLGIESKRVEYRQLAEKLCSLWNKHELPRKLESPAATVGTVIPRTDFSMPVKVVVQIHKIISEHEGGSRRSGELPFLFFQAYVPSADRASLPSAYPDLWKELHSWFMKHCHENGKLPDDEVKKQLEGKFCQLEELFLSVANRFTKTLTTVDEILDQANS